MNRHWNLRAELYHLFHRWPMLLAAIIIGSLLGWGLSYLWPSYHRATSQIYVALNPYRKFSDTIFEALANPKYSNLDNYHYWQMSQLQSAIYLDSFIEPTLARLREKDPYWKTVEIDPLRDMLDSEWRSSGDWALSANHPDPAYAEQAASVWSDVVTVQVAEAIAASRRAFMIDQQLQAGETERLQATLRIEDLETTHQALEDWQASASDLDPEKPLALQERWRVLALISGPAEFTPAWMAALNNQPAADAPVKDYLSWIEQVKLLIQTETATLENHIQTIDEQQTGLKNQYTLESTESLSLSPNIEVKRKEDLGVRQVRPSSTLVLVGGAIGLLIALLIQLVMISASMRRE